MAQWMGTNPEMGKHLSFDLLSAVDPAVIGPRLGKLAVPGREALLTPSFLAVSSRGVIPHLSPDVVKAHAQFGGVHLALEDFIENRTGKTAPPVMGCSTSASPLHTFTSLPMSLVTLLTPRRTPAVAAPHGNTQTSISLFTSTGFQTLTNASYNKYVGTLHPDISVGLADISYGVKPGSKRREKMGDRTQEWITELLSTKNDDQAVFAPILPLNFLEQSEYINYLADEAIENICGLAFYDSDILVDVPATTSFSRLPRLSLDEPTSPHHVLRQISLGMDMFTIPFIGFATDAGIALTFRFPKPLLEDAGTTSSEGSTVKPLGIDMWSPTHAISLLPLSKSCTCYTCTSHHRAYVQHLLSAKEMLGWVLLQIHNHQILSSFFTAIRESIEAGTFEEDRDVFAKNYETELPEKSGQGPRIRGYHFKSEGPGEPKKNKAAWGNLGSEGENSVSETPLVPDDGAAELESKGFAEVVD